jgi:L-2,4-diaminobutyric acid acetyltransferase
MDTIIRPPRLNDGAAIAKLVKQSNTLDINSDYLYFLLSSHFAQTCAIAEQNGQVVAFVTAYRLPDAPSTLFVWQIAVAQSAQGQGLALALLRNLSERDWFKQINQVRCTISPSNKASNRLFQRFAQTISAQVRIEPFLTQAHLGLHHEEEPSVILQLEHPV